MAGATCPWTTPARPCPSSPACGKGCYPPGGYDYDALPFSEEDFAFCADQWVLGLTSPTESVGWGVKGLIEERAPDSDDLVMHEAVPGLIRRLTLATR